MNPDSAKKRQLFDAGKDSRGTFFYRTEEAGISSREGDEDYGRV